MSLISMEVPTHVFVMRYAPWVVLERVPTVANETASARKAVAVINSGFIGSFWQ